MKTLLERLVLYGLGMLYWFAEAIKSFWVALLTFIDEGELGWALFLLLMLLCLIAFILIPC